MSITTDAQNQQTVDNLCNEYRLYQMDKPVPPRYEIVSPYEHEDHNKSNVIYTKDQFDMRRKAEILKYNKQNSKSSNNPTKKQKLSYLISLSTHAKVCPPDPYAVTSTTACDVPGVPRSLFLNPNVPLYNFVTNRSIVVDKSSSINVNIWSQKLFPDIEYLPNVYNTCVVISWNAYKKGPNTFNFQTPISINIKGVKNTLSRGTPVSYIDVKVATAKCTPYYGAIPANPIGINTVTLPSNYNFRVMLPTSGGGFTAAKYIGLLNVDNLILYMAYQFAYKITLTFTLSITLYDVNGNIISGQSDTTISLTEVISNLSLATLLDEPYYNTVFNCSFADASLPAFSEFNMTSNPPNKIDYIPYGALQS